jgi:Na+-driven multidrug efflux pump
MAVLTSVSTVTAQNLGAGKPERIPQVFRWGLAINTPVIALVTLVCLLVPDFVMRLFVHDQAIVDIGVGYFRIVGWGYLFLILPYVSNGVIIGAGKTAVTMIISFVSLCIVRLPLAMWLSHTSLGLSGVWVATLIGFPINAGLGYAYYLSGKWRRTAVLARPGGGAEPGESGEVRKVG